MFIQNVMFDVFNIQPLINLRFYEVFFLIAFYSLYLIDDHSAANRKYFLGPNEKNIYDQLSSLEFETELENLLCLLNFSCKKISFLINESS